jgi:uncharacterized protein (TIGR02594 family)
LFFQKKKLYLLSRDFSKQTLHEKEYWQHYTSSCKNLYQTAHPSAIQNIKIMKLKKLEKLRSVLRKYEDTLRGYQNMFLADGQIDTEEQQKLDKLSADIKIIISQINAKEKELDTGEQTKNALKANEEAKADWSSTTDDVIDPELLHTKLDMGSGLSGSVGKKGANKKEDVQIVQNLLKEKNNAPLKGSGACGPKTIKAIKDFQAKVGLSETGLVAPNDDTWKKLNGSSAATPDNNTDEKPEEKGILAQATRYGYSSDPYANQNDREARGNNNNKLTPGLSVALSPELYQQLGLGRKSGGYIFVTFENGSTKKFQTADQTAKGLKNLRVDFFDPNGEYKSVDGQKLWVKVASGSGSSEEVSSDTKPTDSKDLSIKKSVGKDGANEKEDVIIVQKYLKEKGAKLAGLGVCGPKTIKAISQFQETNMNGFSDGLIDPNGRTWKLLIGSGKDISDDNDTGGGGSLVKPSWISIAEGEKGVKENTSKTKHDPRVMEYHASVKGNINTDETPWCSSFVNWVMNKAGKGGTNSAMAISWKKYGKKLDRPAYGSIAVIDWDGPGPGWKGHVGFVVGKKGNNILLLGGNQANAVNIKTFSTSKIVAYVVPNGYDVPDSAYSFGKTDGDYGSGGDVTSTR